MKDKATRRMAGYIAWVSVTGFMAVLIMLMFSIVPKENKDFFNMGLVALIGFAGTAYGYYLGSSEGSARKTEISADEKQ